MHIGSKPATLRKLRRRIIGTFMDIMIMKELNDGSPMSGHDVTRFFRRKYNVLMKESSAKVLQKVSCRPISRTAEKPGESISD